MTKVTDKMVEVWQPIETAPKDGSVFDAWLGNADKDDIEFYCGRHIGGNRRSPCWHWKDGKFRPFIGLISLNTFVQPTHWRPLPHPPKSDK